MTPLPRTRVRDAAIPLQRGHLAPGAGVPHAHSLGDGGRSGGEPR